MSNGILIQKEGTVAGGVLTPYVDQEPQEKRTSNKKTEGVFCTHITHRIGPFASDCPQMSLQGRITENGSAGKLSPFVRQFL